MIICDVLYKNELQKYRVTAAQSITRVAIARRETDYVTFEIGEKIDRLS